MSNSLAHGPCNASLGGGQAGQGGAAEPTRIGHAAHAGSSDPATVVASSPVYFARSTGKGGAGRGRAGQITSLIEISRTRRGLSDGGGAGRGSTVCSAKRAPSPRSSGAAKVGIDLRRLVRPECREGY